jgi:hypothetical protein
MENGQKHVYSVSHVDIKSVLSYSLENAHKLGYIFRPKGPFPGGDINQ